MGRRPRRSTSPTTAGPGDEIAASAEGRGPLRASHADREQAVNIFVPFAAILVAMLLALPAWLDRHASRQSSQGLLSGGDGEVSRRPYRLTWPDSSRRSIPIRDTQPKLCRSVAPARRRLAGCRIAGACSGGGTRSAIPATDAAGACPDRTQDARDIRGMILDNAAGRDAER